MACWRQTRSCALISVRVRQSMRPSTQPSRNSTNPTAALCVSEKCSGRGSPVHRRGIRKASPSRFPNRPSRGLHPRAPLRGYLHPSCAACPGGAKPLYTLLPAAPASCRGALGARQSPQARLAASGEARPGWGGENAVCFAYPFTQLMLHMEEVRRVMCPEVVCNICEQARGFITGRLNHLAVETC